MLNNGDTTWSEANLYRLASIASKDPFGSRVLLLPGEQIQPNQEKLFSFTVRAPFAGGTYLYPFQWQMVQEGVQTFGAATPPYNVTVLPTARTFFTVTPCRVLDTRDPAGPYGGPFSRTVWRGCSRFGGGVGYPVTTATAVAVNVTVVSPATPGHLELYPANMQRPVMPVSMMNFKAGNTRSNNAVATLDTLGRIETLPVGPYHRRRHRIFSVATVRCSLSRSYRDSGILGLRRQPR